VGDTLGKSSKRGVTGAGCVFGVGGLVFALCRCCLGGVPGDGWGFGGQGIGKGKERGQWAGRTVQRGRNQGGKPPGKKAKEQEGRGGKGKAQDRAGIGAFSSGNFGRCGGRGGGPISI